MPLSNNKFRHLIRNIRNAYQTTLTEIVFDRGYYGVKYFQFLTELAMTFTTPTKRFTAFKRALATLTTTELIHDK
jgi:hypothetical protein